MTHHGAIASGGRVRWCRGDVPVTAADYVERIADHTEALVRGEISGTDESAVGAGQRRQVVGSHALWFRIDESDLIVIRVLHQSRDAGRWVE